MTALITAVLALMTLTGNTESTRFAVDDSTGYVSDAVTGLLWRIGPDREILWMEAGEWIGGLDNGWRCPSPEELAALYEGGVRFGESGPFQLGGNFIWCGSTCCFDSLFCFDLISGSLNRIAEWRAFEYLRGFRVMAVSAPGS